MKHEPSEREELACALAWAYHKDQKYGDEPYVTHLRQVRDVLLEFKEDTAFDEDLLCAAWLHDIIEDTDCPARTIAKMFGTDVLNMVWAVTGFGENRRQRAQDAYKKIECWHVYAILKCADRIANVRASIGTDKMQMYMKAWPEFKRHVACSATTRMFNELVNLHASELLKEK